MFGERVAHKHISICSSGDNVDDANVGVKSTDCKTSNVVGTDCQPSNICDAAYQRKRLLHRWITTTTGTLL